MSVMLGTSTSKASDRILPLLGSLRPSERKELLVIARSDVDLFMSALEAFLSRWATSSWIEEYNVERVGRWIGKNCPNELIVRSINIARKKRSANGSSESIHDRTYNAFLSGLTIH